MHHSYKIIADENMPLVNKLFSSSVDVKLIPGREIRRHHLKDVDVLLVRSVTRVDQKLLHDTSVKFVGSATSGTDHIDVEYLDQNGVVFAHAPGCNAIAVAEYSLSAMSSMCKDWASKKVSVVGCGNVGLTLLSALSSFDVECNFFDPFVKRDEFCQLNDLEKIIDSDLICFHTPLTIGGDFPTENLVDDYMLEALRPGTAIINAGRGEVVSGKALLKCLKQKKKLRVALDVWEKEPSINLDLLEMIDIGTPHIAGNTIEGKLRGTWMLHKAFLDWIGYPEMVVPEKNVIKSTQVKNNMQIDSVSDLCLKGYDIGLDNRLLRDSMPTENRNDILVAKIFDGLRKNYRQRHEYLTPYLQC
jgi:erythronate-4-phosphate dehydrogenase